MQYVIPHPQSTVKHIVNHVEKRRSYNLLRAGNRNGDSRILYRIKADTMIERVFTTEVRAGVVCP